MYILVLIIQIIVFVSGCLAALVSIPIFLRLHWPAPAWWFIKLYASACSRVFAFIGVLCMIVGLTTGSILISLVGIYNVLIFSIHAFKVTRPPDSSCGFEQAFGLHWEDKIKSKQKNHFLKERTILKMPAVPNPRIEQNISFATIPGTSRKILCDIWQPPLKTAPSGLAFIYLHGSAW